ncbi:MAG TPA: DNA-processing protein DprA [Terriglobales bacterium]|nr:DNA-processing protein DprA [Terriglobales bacterium]
MRHPDWGIDRRRRRALACAVPAAATSSALPLWLGLVLTPGLGQRGAQRLLETFATAEAIYAASLTELEACQLPPAVAHSLKDGRSAELGAREAEQVQLQGLQVVTLGDRAYPELLREIYDPPILLYLRGELAALDRFGVAVVGTRHPTLYGRLMAERLGGELAHWGLTVFSGLARGIDATGQKACVEAGGATVAVLGTGVDVIYPSENRKLAEAILAHSGALVSEFPLGTPPTAQNFPIRNRVISGLALGVLVVEGGEFSGSRITARMALEQNREVFAVPGMVTQKQAWLPNALIKQGAKLVTEAVDIVEELPSAVRARLRPPPPTPADATPEAAAHSALRQQVLHALAVDNGTHVDEIVNSLQNKLSAPEILAVLFDLELEGAIRQLPGKKFLRVS